MEVKLIIFDFDGTLGDTRHNIVVTLQRTMQLRGLEIRSEETCARTIGLTLEDSFLSMYPSMSRAEARECVTTYRDIFYRSIEELTPSLFPHVAQTLHRLHDKGVVMSIASSRSSPSLHLFLRNMGIATYFPYILGSDSVERHKPDPEPVVKTLRDMGYNAAEAVVVGDMPVDIAMAHNAGIKAIGVSYGNATRAELIAAGADIVIDDFAKLSTLIE